MLTPLTMLTGVKEGEKRAPECPDHTRRPAGLGSAHMKAAFARGEDDGVVSIRRRRFTKRTHRYASSVIAARPRSSP